MKTAAVGLPSDYERESRFRTFPVLMTIATALIVAGASIGYTQYIAKTFAYDPQLGRPIVGHFYEPWAWYPWTKLYAPYHRATFLVGFLTAIGGACVAFIISATALGYGTRRTRLSKTLHGSAHWATLNEIRATGLLPPRPRLFRKPRPGAGVYVGAFKDKSGKVLYLRHNGPEHILTFAPTRSGKGVSLIIPTLLSWPHSCVVNDLKGENWALTAGWRKKQGHTVLKFDPCDKDGNAAAYNPLEEIRLGTDDEVADAQNLVNIIIDPDGKGLQDHWDKTSFMFLVGVVLYSMYRERELGGPCTLLTLRTTMTSTEGVEQLYTNMKDNHFGPNGTAHRVIQQSSIDMLEKEEKERGSVLSTTKTFFALFDDPIVCRNVSRSDFRIKDLMNATSPVTLYLVIDPQNKDRLKPLVRLMLTQIVRNLTPRLDRYVRGMAVPKYKHRLLLLLDEFDALGKLPIFQSALAHIAGYGLKAYIFVQDLNQLTDKYGEKESISAACHIKNAFAPNTTETAKKLSEMAGTATVISSSVTTSGGRFGVFLKQVSQTPQATARPLLTPDECSRLPSARKDPYDESRIVEAGDMLIFVAGSAPIYGKQLLYFKDPVLRKRSEIAAPLCSDRVRAPKPQ